MAMMEEEAILEGKYGGDMLLQLSHYILRTISVNIRLFRME